MGELENVTASGCNFHQFLTAHCHFTERITFMGFSSVSPTTEHVNKDSFQIVSSMLHATTQNEKVTPHLGLASFRAKQL